MGVGGGDGLREGWRSLKDVNLAAEQESRARDRRRLGGCGRHRHLPRRRSDAARGERSVTP
eukprot:scaffold120683_cov23-Tisochrysis_lutea.AAC.1